MRGKACIALGLAIVLLPAANAGSAISATHQRRCAPRFQPVLLSDRQAQIYLRGERAYACLRGTRRAISLAANAPRALTGTVVAYEPTSPFKSRLIVRSIASGRVLHEINTHVERVHGANADEARILAVRLTGEGSIAWIQEDSGAGRSVVPAEYAVYGVDQHGFHAFQTELTSRPSRLAIKGRVLSWTLGLPGNPEQTDELL